MFLFIALSCSLLCYGFHSSLFLYFIIVKILKLLMRLRRWISLLPFEKYAVLNPAVTLSALIEIAETISWDIPRRYLDICQDDILRYANTISWDMPQRYIEICKDDILRYAKTISWHMPRYLKICQYDILRYATTISWDMQRRYFEICQDRFLHIHSSLLFTTT